MALSAQGGKRGKQFVAYDYKKQAGESFACLFFCQSGALADQSFLKS